MNHSTRRSFITLTLAAAAGSSWAQAGFPNKPMRIIVAFPPGGSTTVVARLLGQKLSERLGQAVVIDNRPGGNGVIASEELLKSTPDGHHMVMVVNTHTINPHMMARLPYNTERDFSPVSTLYRFDLILVAHPAVPANNLRELVAYYKANPGKKNYGSTGSGSITHLAAELLKAEAGVDVVHVPYAGAAPALTSLLGGHVEMVVLDVPVLMAQIKAGKVKAIAVTSATRASAIPDVPTMTEAGYPKVNSDNWYGLVGAVAIPQPIQQRIRAAAVKTLNSPEVAKQFASISAVPIPSTSEEYRKFVVAEQAKWSAVIKAIGFQPEE